MPDMPWRAMSLASRLIMRRADLTVEGAEYLPAQGPAVIAARHYHHLYDGPALIVAIPRRLHLIVALDWISRKPLRGVMQRLCQALAWPTILRTPSGTTPCPEAQRALRRATKESVQLLRSGEVVVIFPEGYPNIDPGYTPKTGDDFLPFQAGAIRLAALAATANLPVPVVPAGFAYQPGARPAIALRFGPPLDISPGCDLEAALCRLEAEVKRLSVP